MSLKQLGGSSSQRGVQVGRFKPGRHRYHCCPRHGVDLECLLLFCLPILPSSSSPVTLNTAETKNGSTSGLSDFLNA